MDRGARLQRVSALRGVNYWPSWGRSPVDHWTSACRPDVLHRELGFVAGLGLNGVRLWNSARGYERDPAVYLSNLRAALDRCDELELSVHLVLFDSCGVDPELGPGDETTVGELADRLGTDPLLRWERSAYEDNPGLQNALVVVPDRGQLVTAIWEGWVPNPGYHHLGPDEWPRWETYATSVVTALRDHSALVLIELMNEPFITHLQLQDDGLRIGVETDPIRAFYTRVHRLVRELAPAVPLTMGAESLSSFEVHEFDLGEPLDVVSFHPLTYDLEDMASRLADALDYAGGRPALASEWGSFPGVPDERQLAYYREALPVVMGSGCAWEITHLIAGWGPFALTALLYPNGTMRPAAQHLRSQLREMT